MGYNPQESLEDCYLDVPDRKLGLKEVGSVG